MQENNVRLLFPSLHHVICAPTKFEVAYIRSGYIFMKRDGQTYGRTGGPRTDFDSMLKQYCLVAIIINTQYKPDLMKTFI